MGNQQSEFEIEFYNKYSYIQSIDDRHFGQVKVYRKNTFRYDYIMVLEMFFDDENEEQIKQFFKRIDRIKSIQNECTMKIYNHKIVNENAISCEMNKIIIYAQYLNRNLFDYLCALRSNVMFSLEIQEICYVLKQTTKSAIMLKRMGICSFSINSKCIFLSVDGEIVLCPLKYLKQSLLAAITQQKLTILEKNYQKYSVTQLLPQNNPFPQKKDFKALLLQLSGNLHPHTLKESKFLNQIIQSSQCLEQLFSALPVTQCQNLRIDQMYKGDNSMGQFYNLD